MTMCIHLLLHLVDAVREFGPLFVFSCFPVEALDGIWKSFVHGSNYPELQIHSFLSLMYNLTDVKVSDLIENEQVSAFCDRTENMSKLRRKPTKLCDKTYMLGSWHEGKLDRFNAIFGPFINNDCQLHSFKRLFMNGVTYETESHGIDGYVETFTGLIKFICRYCDMSFDEFLQDPSKFQPLRTIEEYSENAAEAEATKTTVKGIKANSSLDNLQAYHVPEPGLPPCIDHDVYEGFAAYDLWLCIEYLVKQKCSEIDVLNFRLNDFKFKGEAKMFIPKVDLRRLKGRTLKLAGTASQMERTILILPLVVADLMSESTSPAPDDVWHMVILLKDISSTISAPSLSDGQVTLFKNDCVRYLKLRQKCFPGMKLRPKHKYLMHYHELIQYFGPLKHCSTLRFEAKHFYFQSATKHQKNYKNLTQSLAEKYGRLQSINDDYCAATTVKSIPVLQTKYVPFYPDL
ncbi:hypothetical protein QAD02_013344 [Eretmocerus hayati]|uniref:Uncharacterized protein n=1 Tax=Eretmocerus hayati TaxID=131215 RepID=A0ACC2P2E9_9HYME|nr:hypothetical protein QAD02_013344 [Eretmocerus hayati]